MAVVLWWTVVFLGWVLSTVLVAWLFGCWENFHHIVDDDSDPCPRPVNNKED